MKNILRVAPSPHIKHPDTTQSIMLDVVLALLPSAVFGCILFGLHAAAVLLTCLAAAVLSEYLWCLLFKKPQTVTDFSAAVTGLLLGLNLPPDISLWKAALGSVVAIIVVKQLFGGLGCNFANPAITARIVLLVSFPAAMTSFSEPIVHTVTSATPLALVSSAEASVPTLKNLFFGMHSGCIGETSAFLIIIGGIYLVIRGIISPVTPVCFIGTVGLLSLICGDSVSVAVLGGGLMLGAVFMATDYVTTPTTRLGKAVFGLGCGIITFVIRKFGSLPEGVSYSILIMNILVPHINKFTLSKPFGYVKPAKEEKVNE